MMLPYFNPRSEGWECRVQSPHLALLHCNMTITADQDVVASHAGTTRISVPGLVFLYNIRQLKCESECAIRGGEESRRRMVKRISVIQDLTSPPDNQSLFNYDSESGPATRWRTLYRDLVILLSCLLLITVISSIYLMKLSASLKKKLRRKERIHGKVPPSLPERTTERETDRYGNEPVRSPMYSRINRIPSQCHNKFPLPADLWNNECHHYNTVSLQLSDCLMKEQQMSLMKEQQMSLMKESRIGSLSRSQGLGRSKTLSGLSRSSSENSWCKTNTVPEDPGFARLRENGDAPDVIFTN